MRPAFALIVVLAVLPAVAQEQGKTPTFSPMEFMAAQEDPDAFTVDEAVRTGMVIIALILPASA